MTKDDSTQLKLSANMPLPDTQYVNSVLLNWILPVSYDSDATHCHNFLFRPGRVDTILTLFQVIFTLFPFYIRFRI